MANRDPQSLNHVLSKVGFKLKTVYAVVAISARNELEEFVLSPSPIVAEDFLELLYFVVEGNFGSRYTLSMDNMRMHHSSQV
jgi:hypothetical protein